MFVDLGILDVFFLYLEYESVNRARFWFTKEISLLHGKSVALIWFDTFPDRATFFNNSHSYAASVDL